MLNNWSNEKKLETAFIGVFSGVIIVLFYVLISLNGLVLGNDSAVHLGKAQFFLKTGQIPSGSVGWIPPLFELMLAIIISLCGASNDIAQMIFLLKAFAVLANLLLFFSIYVIGSKFFNKKIGALSAVFLAMCYPTYELNTWGGYTTVLGLAFLLLLFYYSYLASKQFGYVVVNFLVVFGIVINHQLTAFLAVVIMLPVMLLLLKKFKGKYLIGFVVTVLGGAIAFFAYYFQPIAEYLDIIIYHVFFENKAYVVQIPFTDFEHFLLYFGFIQFLAIGGIGVSYYWLKQQKTLILFLTLILSLFIPFFFAQSHVFGFLLPFEWFTYYLTPPIAIFAAVFVVFLAGKISLWMSKGHYKIQKKWLKIASITLIATICVPVIVLHVDNTYTKLTLAVKHNSTADIDAYDAAIWLSQNYEDSSSVVVTQKHGDWFGIYSGKHVISQTLDWTGRTPVADSVLNLDYELQGSQTMVKAYEINNFITDENYVPINLIWNRVSFSSLTGDFLSFNQNGIDYSFSLSELNRTVSNNYQTNPRIEFKYFNTQVEITQIIDIQNNSYPINISWELHPIHESISNVTLYITTYLDLSFNFDIVQIPHLINWLNPWDIPSKNTNGNEWATVDFFSTDLTAHYLGVYDQQNQTAFSIYFTDLPSWGNIGALTNHEIDAIRYQYYINKIDMNQTVTRQYQMLTLAKNNYPMLQFDNLHSLFDTKVESFPISVHNFKEYIAEHNIQFIVYDITQLDGHTSLPLGSSFLPQLHQASFLQLVYSNKKYEVFKILDNYNQTHLWN